MADTSASGSNSTWAKTLRISSHSCWRPVIFCNGTGLATTSLDVWRALCRGVFTGARGDRGDALGELSASDVADRAITRARTFATLRGTKIGTGSSRPFT